ncbi:FecCD family ABC transporter permease [Edaphobacillus lindanitolerans]|uniref:Iron complex transport system permease protein n=1 Tax=Edaphobacillus lindanitolerans TaxID=550447 RepID=A0A1U7PMK3_9BACI|nr:iron ABC transporter permease [Edaphobacillus lindanitolerans]SIT71701.1 iron complex transport system permease protein [Edaphobacillus lindanitolerans]
MRERKKHPVKWAIILSVMFISAIVIALSSGAAGMTVDRLLPVLFGQGTPKESFVLFELRLPRVAVITLAGIALAVSGTLLQTVTRNDLADPGIIGIHSGAGMAITVFYLFAGGDLPNYAFLLPAVGFAGALATAGLIWLFSMEKGRGIMPVRLLLVGIGFASALSGGMMILISGADRQDVAFIAEWLAGSVWGADWPFVFALLPWVALLVPFIYYRSNTLNVLALTEPSAIGLGVKLARTRFLMIAIAVALAAAAVSVTGYIAFVGLMAPHIARALAGPRHERFLPVAMLVGALLLVGADTIGHSLPAGLTVPAGIVVALIGAPYFLYLMRKG